jgi:protein-S-isoprenylcysteine O-methyltransferase Ste14
MTLTWHSIDGPLLWDLPRFVVVIPLIAALGMIWINARFDPVGQLGLRQAWAGDKPQPPDTLMLVGPYRFVRHPLMACLLVFLWAQPVMTPTLALLSGGLTVYILIGVLLEERDLLRRFHPDYASYRQRVPAIIPWRRPKW